ncbi:hypothetical protein APUTEX25_001697, partial [Auxenochlorella protothecoides]
HTRVRREPAQELVRAAHVAGRAFHAGANQGRIGGQGHGGVLEQRQAVQRARGQARPGPSHTLASRNTAAMKSGSFRLRDVEARAAVWG